MKNNEEQDIQYVVMSRMELQDGTVSFKLLDEFSDMLDAAEFEENYKEPCETAVAAKIIYRGDTHPLDDWDTGINCLFDEPDLRRLSEENESSILAYLNEKGYFIFTPSDNTELNRYYLVTVY